MTYFISINSDKYEALTERAAYATFREACHFSHIVGALVTLIDGETGELLADNGELQ